MSIDKIKFLCYNFFKKNKKGDFYYGKKCIWI